MPRALKKMLKRLRMWWLLHFRYRLRACGRGTYLAGRAFIMPNVAWIGAHTFLGDGCHLAVLDIVIGNYVMFASHVAVVGGDHRFDVVGTPMVRTGLDDWKPVRVEDDVWVGHGAIIMHGVTLGEGCIVAAGSVVTRDVPPYQVVAGVPARRLRDRFDADRMAAHRAALAEMRKSLPPLPPPRSFGA